ncbi:MAG TPA: type II secretion system F family protein [Actinomycetota bacterium]|nr:type II secretion system F family protein [Actinomycetota bacterium]
MRGRRTEAEALAAAAAAVRTLAALLAAGLPPGAALMAWPNHLFGPERAEARRAARRLCLDSTPAEALSSLRGSFTAFAGVLGRALDAQSRCGGRLSEVLDAVATGMDARAAALRRYRAAGEGATLSGRLVAGLPLLGLPAVPLSRAPLFDVPGVVFLGLGLLFLASGLWWIERLRPRPDPELEDRALTPVLAAALVSAGTPLADALCAATAGLSGRAGRAARETRARVVLGTPWARALEEADDEGLRRLGAAVAATERLGTPVVDVMHGLAATERDRVARAVEVAARRAPVMMVVPLTVCLLPAFICLAVVPFLRGVASG